MCKEVIRESKIEKVIYAAKNGKTKTEDNYTQVFDKKLIDKCTKLIKSKFLEFRNR